MSNQQDDPTVDLDPAVATRLATALGWERPPDTMAEFADGTRETFVASLGRPLGPRDMCTTDDSPHEARVGGETHRYQCVLDAFVLGALLDEPVTVHTTCPVSDAAVTVEFEGGEPSALSAPPGAVMSYGVRRTVAAPEGDVTPEELYGQLCGYSHVFASREEYEEWTDATPEAVTQAVPLSDGLHGVRRIVAVGPFDRPGGAPGSGAECC